MAIFGRRQPHAPLVLRGQLPPRKAVGRCLVVGQKTGQAAADRYFRRSFAPKIIKGGGRPAGARIVAAGQKPSQAAAAWFRRQFAPVIKTVGGAPSRARAVLVGQKTSQLAADRFFRRSFPPIIRRAGPRPSTSVIVAVGQRTSQLAARRTWRRGVLISLPPPIPVVPTAPIGAVKLFGARAAQAAADRFFRRRLVPQVLRAGGRPALGRLAVVGQRAGQAAAYRPARRGVFISPGPPAPVVVAAPVGVARLFGQKASQAAADRSYRRSFAPLVKRAGGRPGAARLISVGQKASQAAAYRPGRLKVLVNVPPPAPVVPAAPVGRARLFGQRTSQAAADRLFRRAFPPVVKRARGTTGPPPPPLPDTGRVICLDGYDRAVTSATGATGASAHQGYDRGITTIGDNNLDC